MKKIPSLFSFMILIALVLTPCRVFGEWQAPSADLLPEAKVLPKSGSAARWLWFQAPGVLPRRSAYYRRTVDVPEGKIASAICYVGLDDGGEFYLNGRKVPQIPFPQPDFQVKFRKYDLAGLLHPGANTLAFVAVNDAASGGMIMRGEIRMASGKTIPLVSDENFKAAEKVPDNWNQPGFDDSAWLPAMPFGDVLTQPWFSVSDIFNIFTTDAEKAAFRQARENAADAVIPADAPDLKAKIVWNNHVAGLEVNGKVFPPATYLLGNNPWTPEVADILLKTSRAGFHFYEYQTSSNNMFRQSGEYDFSAVDINIRRILTLDPDAMLFIKLRFDLFSAWLDQHPDEMIGYATGPADSGDDILRRKAPSMASAAFRAEMKNFTRAFVEHLKKYPWFKRVIAFRVSHGVYSEWHYYGMGNEMPDTGKAMTARFRLYLKAKYKTDAALQKAWHNPRATLAAAEVPGAYARRGRKRFLRDPNSPDMAVIDYYRCHSEVVTETMLLMAQTVKETAPKLLVGAYYGYIFGMPYPAEGMTVELDKVLKSPYIDFLSAPHCYDAESRNVGGDGLPRTLISTFRRYGKLHIYEADTRTHLAGRDGFGNARTSADSVAVIKRDYANAWLNGCAIQFLHVGIRQGQRCWFNSPEILTAMREGLNIWPQFYHHVDTGAVNPDIAVIFDPEALLEHGYPEREDQSRMSQALGNAALHGLYRSGFIFDLLSPEDYLATGKKYRTVVFLNLVNPASEERERIKKRLNRDQSNTIWCYAPGLVTEQGWSPEAMTDLTGIKLAADPAKRPLAIRLTAGKVMERVIRKVVLTEAPRVHSVDSQAEVLGRYVDGNQPALVKKSLSGGNFTAFSGMPIIDPAVWAELLISGGSHRYNDNRIVLLSGSGALGVHAARGGAYKITLPGPVNAVGDAFQSPVVLQADKKNVILKSTGPETWLLIFK